MSHHKPAALPPQSQQQQTGAVVPPPQPIPPPSSVGDQADTDMHAQKSKKHATAPQPSGAHRVVAWIGRVALVGGVPLALVAAVLGGIVGAKALRRRRRRLAPRISTRFVGGWRELVDHARDLGQPIPLGPATRREQARSFDREAAPTLARTADRHVFGPSSPLAEAASAYWVDVDAERRAMLDDLPRLRRIRALLSLRSFRG